jgi:hypothetical protein
MKPHNVADNILEALKSAKLKPPKPSNAYKPATAQPKHEQQAYLPREHLTSG